MGATRGSVHLGHVVLYSCPWRFSQLELCKFISNSLLDEKCAFKSSVHETSGTTSENCFYYSVLPDPSKVAPMGTPSIVGTVFGCIVLNLQCIFVEQADILCNILQVNPISSSKFWV